MKLSSRSGIIILFVTVTLSTLVLFPILQIVVERDPQLSAYDEDWNDISNFRQALEEEEDTSYIVSAILSNPAVLDDIADPSSSLLIIAGIESPYTELELEIDQKYLQENHLIVLLDQLECNLV